MPENGTSSTKNPSATYKYDFTPYTVWSIKSYLYGYISWDTEKNIPYIWGVILKSFTDHVFCFYLFNIFVGGEGVTCLFNKSAFGHVLSNPALYLLFQNADYVL